MFDMPNNYLETKMTNKKKYDFTCNYDMLWLKDLERTRMHDVLVCELREVRRGSSLACMHVPNH